MRRPIHLDKVIGSILLFIALVIAGLNVASLHPNSSTVTASGHAIIIQTAHALSCPVDPTIGADGSTCNVCNTDCPSQCTTGCASDALGCDANPPACPVVGNSCSTSATNVCTTTAGNNCLSSINPDGECNDCSVNGCTGADCRADGTCFSNGTITPLGNTCRTNMNTNDAQCNDCSKYGCTGANCRTDGTCVDSVISCITTKTNACTTTAGNNCKSSIDNGTCNDCSIYGCTGANCRADGTCVVIIGANPENAGTCITTAGNACTTSEGNVCSSSISATGLCNDCRFKGCTSQNCRTDGTCVNTGIGGTCTTTATNVCKTTEGNTCKSIIKSNGLCNDCSIYGCTGANCRTNGTCLNTSIGADICTTTATNVCKTKAGNACLSSINADGLCNDSSIYRCNPYDRADGTCLPNAEGLPGTYVACVNDTCTRLPGIGVNNAYCFSTSQVPDGKTGCFGQASPSHFSCVNDTCTSVPGEPLTLDGCAISGAPCGPNTHTECQSSRRGISFCVSVLGAGRDTCLGGLSCFGLADNTTSTSINNFSAHNACLNGTCVRVENSARGSSPADDNQCSTVGTSCTNNTGTHLSCVSQACTVVSGTGIDNCLGSGNVCNSGQDIGNAAYCLNGTCVWLNPSILQAGSQCDNPGFACSSGPPPAGGGGIVNGSCGSANGQSASSAPTSNLCSSGTASAVSVSAPWTWSCVGSGGGSTASCSAPACSPSFIIAPPSANATVGNTLQFAAWYDPDGPSCSGGQLNVTSNPSTTWTSQKTTVATSQGSGSFRGIAPGTAPVQAVYAGLTATASLDVISASIPDFSLHANPSSLSIALGSSATSQITITALNGFSGTVSLSQSGLPAGVSMTLPPSLGSNDSASPSFLSLFRRAAASLVPTLINSSQASTLTLAVSNATLPGAYTIHVTGTSGAISHTLDFPLVITGVSPATHLGCNASNTCALLPGAGAPLCSPVGSSCGSGPATHLGCNASNTCALLPGAGTPSCSPAGSSCLSGPPTHLGCNASNTCAVLAGGGADSCFSVGSPCSGTGTHHECVANSCGTIFGAGPDRCATSADCNGGDGGGGGGGGGAHGACDASSRSCVNRAGSGSSTCLSDTNCGTITPRSTHFECQNSTCLIVGGAGADQCAGPIGAFCISPFSCTMSATPAALFTPPAASVNLSWTCSGGAGVTNCTVRKVAGAVLISGGGAGSVSNTPAASSQYSLTCTNSGTGTTDTKTVTVTVNGLLFHEVSPGGR
jgi:hypothetical protein